MPRGHLPLMKAAGPQKSLKPLRWSAQLDALSAACLRVTMLGAIAEFERKADPGSLERRRARAKVNGVHFGRKGADSGRTTR
jgi:DNA invertase Pin-like site-specific DNA recombinase